MKVPFKCLLPLFLILLLLFAGCTKQNITPGATSYFTVTLSEDYPVGVGAMIILQDGGGYVLGHPFRLFEVGAEGEALNHVDYTSDALIFTRNGWYGIRQEPDWTVIRIEKLDNNLRLQKPINLNMQPSDQHYYAFDQIDVSPDGRRMVITTFSQLKIQVLFIDSGTLRWQYEFPLEIEGIEMIDLQVFLLNSGEIQAILEGRKDGEHQLYRAELSLQSGKLGALQALDIGVNKIHRLWTIDDYILIWGANQVGSAHTGDAILRLDQQLNRTHFQPHPEGGAYDDLMLSRAAGYLFLCTYRAGTGEPHIIDQFDMSLQAIDSWQLRNNTSIYHIEIDQYGDFLILGQLDNIIEFRGQFKPSHFIRAPSEDPFADFY